MLVPEQLWEQVALLAALLCAGWRPATTFCAIGCSKGMLAAATGWLTAAARAVSRLLAVGGPRDVGGLTVGPWPRWPRVQQQFMREHSVTSRTRTGTRRDSVSLTLAAMHNFPADGPDLRPGPGSGQGVLRHDAVGLPGERMVRRSGDERHHRVPL